MHFLSSLTGLELRIYALLLKLWSHFRYPSSMESRIEISTITSEILEPLSSEIHSCYGNLKPHEYSKFMKHQKKLVFFKCSLRKNIDVRFDDSVMNHLACYGRNFRLELKSSPYKFTLRCFNIFHEYSNSFFTFLNSEN